MQWCSQKSENRGACTLAMHISRRLAAKRPEKIRADGSHAHYINDVILSVGMRMSMARGYAHAQSQWKSDHEEFLAC